MRNSEDMGFWNQPETDVKLIGKKLHNELNESLNHETEKRLQEALRLINQDKDDPRAHYLLAVHYHNGWGIDKNTRLARKHYEAAAELGHAGACYELCLAYLSGNTEMGIEKNYEKVIYYTKNANSKIEDEKTFDDANYKQKNYLAQLKNIAVAVKPLKTGDNSIKKKISSVMETVSKTKVFEEPITPQQMKEKPMKREDDFKSIKNTKGEEQPQPTGLPPIPSDWICPITGEIMFDPVLVTVSGQSYEREALERWLQTNNTDPKTKQIIPDNGYTSNHALQSTIIQFAKFIPGMWERGQETIHKSQRLRDNVWNAANSGNEDALSRWLELDPRVIYEESNGITLLEFLSSDKKRIACMQRVIGHAEHNHLGGLTHLKKITKNSKALFFNLASCDGQEQIIAHEMLKKLCPIMGWNDKIFLEFYFEACANGLVNALPAFITLNVPLNLFHSSGKTALHLAVKNNQSSVVQWLLNHFQGNDLFVFLLKRETRNVIRRDRVEVYEQGTIFQMLGNNNQQLSKIIKDTLGADKEYKLLVHVINNSERTRFPHSYRKQLLKILAQTLMWDNNFYQNAAKQAVLSGSIVVLKESLLRGATVDYRYEENEGKTLLHLAAIYASNRADSSSQERDAQDSHQALLHTLINHNAAINAQDNSGRTVLHVATIQCAPGTFFKALLGCENIDLWIPDKEGKIAIEYLYDPALWEEPRLTLLGQVYNPENLFEYLLSKYSLDEKLRAFFSQLKWNENLYLRCAFKFAEKGNTELLKACLDLGVEPNACLSKDRYLLATAIIGGLNCVKILLARGANIHVRTQNDNTLLHEAVHHQKLEIAYELLERGLGISNRKGKAENAQGQTAEEYAEQLGYMELANAIRERRKQIKYRPFIKQETQALEQKIQTLEKESTELKKQKKALTPLFQMFKAEKKLLQPMNIGTHNNSIYALLVHPKGYLISGGRDCLIKIWDMSDYICLSTLKDHPSTIFDFALIQETQYLASASGDKTIKIWNFKDPKNVSCIATLVGHKDCVDALAELPNKHLVSGSRDKTIKIWDLNNLANPQCIATFECDGPEAFITFSSGKNNSIYFASNAGKDIKIWDATDLKSPKCLSTLKGHTGLIRDFTLIGNQLISASADKTIKIWDISDLNAPKLIATLEGHTNEVAYLEKLPNGWLASASLDKTIKIWDLSTKSCITTLESQQKIQVLGITSDGNIVSGTRRNTDEDNKPTLIQLWSRAAFMPAQSLIDEVEQAVPECKQM